jgi:hypothetical protein
MSREVTNPGSAVGEAIGKLIEADLTAAVREIAEPLNHSVKSRTLRNHLRNQHQIDIVVSDPASQPVILIEPKYLRYKKHNWDKGSRLCIAHYSLRRTYPSIRKSIGVLAGEWTDASVQFIQSFGVETYRIPFDHIADILEKHGIPFRWDEKDTQTPKEAWHQFCRLSAEEKKEIAAAITAPVRQPVIHSVETTLRSDPNAPRRVETVELSIRTSEGEHLVYSFRSVSEAIRRLLTFVTDVEDLQRTLR